jgi:ubiquinone/menaquinone biosynthesis C-methylase UbiE
MLLVDSTSARIGYGSMEIQGPRHTYRVGLMVRWLLKYLQSGLVLDAGCGSGTLSFRLVERGFTVKGIDLASGFIEMINRKKRGQPREERLEVRQSSITEIEFPDGMFDAVVCGEVLEHVKGDVQAVREFNRVLKPGGLCVVTVPTDPEGWNFSDEWVRHFRRYSAEQLRSLFEDNGFAIERISRYGFPIGWLYYYVVFLPYLRAQIRRSSEVLADQEENIVNLDVRGGGRFISFLLSLLFRCDELFMWLPYGLNLIMVARKASG